ncbi:TetR/AcrR family transcriptional regulator [Maricaulis salignorans]|uniref:TetR/AcrR family transcriptional regulator n=1 Tax=Maricaulis salignorans TaxID=144026 RepID=UPI003A8D5ED3
MSKSGEETRTRILKACWTLLEQGPDAPARMSDIARASGVSRQAVYLHFPNRTELLIATTRFIDEASDIGERLATSRATTGGPARLDAYIEAWGNYIPVIHGVGSALMAMAATDEAARAAWADRMTAMRHGCDAAIQAIARDRRLRPGLDPVRATDLVWTLLSVRNWEHLVSDCGWTQDGYVSEIKRLARAAVVADTD